MVGVGLDVMVRDKIDAAQAATIGNSIHTIRGCVALARCRIKNAPPANTLSTDDKEAYTRNAYLAEEVRGLQHARLNTIAKLDYLKGRGDTTYGYRKEDACYLDVVPDDKDFYIGQSFETHEEHDKIISGTDLTNTVPLHVNLKFPANPDGLPNAKARQGDLLTAFIHYDAVLRIQEDGSVITSM